MQQIRPVRRGLVAVVIATLAVGALGVASVSGQTGEYYYRLVPTSPSPTSPEGLCWYIPANTPVWNETDTDIWNLDFEGEEEWNYPPGSEVNLSVFAPPGNLIFTEPWAVLDPNGDSGSSPSGTGAQIPDPEVTPPFDAVFRWDLLVNGVLEYRAEVTFLGVEDCNVQGAGAPVEGSPIPLAFAEEWFVDEPIEPIEPIEPPVNDATEPAPAVIAAPRLTG
jgi:hypothetical protein